MERRAENLLEIVPQIKQIEASQHFGTVGAAKHGEARIFWNPEPKKD